MSAHHVSSHYGSNQYLSNHYGRTVVFIITPGGGLDEEGFVLKKRRSRTEDELALLIFMVSAIEQDRDS